MKKIVLTLITVLWLGVIFAFSSSKGEESSSTSDSFIESTIINVCKFFNSDITSQDEKELIDAFSYPIRKMAHFTEYLILGILVFFTFKEYKMNYFYLYALLFCIFYASIDEVHQFFVAGRDCNVKDVMIDTLGSLSSICYLCHRKKRGNDYGI